MPRAERREQLLNTARDIIRDGGIGALTMSALAEQSGASKPVVYEHFENSEAVAIALLDASFDTTASLAVSRLGAAETIYEYLDIVIDVLFEINARETPLVRSITNGFSSTSEVNAFYLSQHKRSHAVYMDLLLQQGLDEKVARLAAYALLEMVAAVVAEFDGHHDLINNQTLKQMVRGAVRSLVPDNQVRPLVPHAILDPSKNGPGRSRA